MSPINLLPDEMREGKNERTVEKKEKEEVKLTKPILDEISQKEPSPGPAAGGEAPIRRSRGWFSFKKKETPPSLGEAPILPEKPAPSPAEIRPESSEKIPELAEILAEEPAPPAQKPEIKPLKEEEREAEELVKVIPEKSLETPEITLMPEKEMIIPRIIRERTLILTAAVIVIITIFGIVWLYANWHFEKLGMEVEQLTVDSELLTVRSRPYLELRDKINALENKASQVEKILTHHIHWTKFFNFLESYTIPDVYFGDFKADTSGQIKLNAVAKDLVSVARQVIVFSSAPDFIKNVDVSNIKKTPEGIAFSFDLVLAESVFYK